MSRKANLNVYGEDQAKTEISKHKWKLLEDTLRTEFNSRLKKQKLPAGRFVIGQTSIERLFGKERWWLYTMTNAATENIDDRRGWRKALRYALCANPIDEQRSMSPFDAMLKRSEEE